MIMEMEIRPHHSCIMKFILGSRSMMSNMQEVLDHVQQNNRFSMKQVYMKLKDIGSEQVHWKRLFYGNVARPRALMTLWLTYHGKWPTKDMLHRFGLMHDNMCCFCSNIEHIDHLFLIMRSWRTFGNKCLLRKKVTHELKIWHEEKKWILMHSKGKGWRVALLRLATVETIYGSGRNYRYHNL